ncbi:unnamed protein product [Effrenium voratum]|nr:unnamed protein product [Effrenium voratum]
MHCSHSDTQAACARRRPMAGRRWRTPRPWQTGSAGVTVAWAAVVVLVCGTARCPGAAVGAVAQAATPGRLHVRGAVPGASSSSKKLLGCVCGGMKRPCFGFQGDKRPSCCAKCKLEGMVDIKHSRCNCGRAQPAFGMPEDAQASCCAKCKLEGMVDIRNPRCNCGRARPHFGMPNDACPSCCAKCKLEGMVDIRSRRCNCGRAIPCFGMPEDARASCCAKCKLEGMVDILHPKCSVCGTRASYPDAAGVPRQLCAAHSAEVGAHVLSLPSWSRAASDCLDLLEEEQGFNYRFRRRFDEEAGAWSGEEFAGLVPDRAFRPDAHDPQRREIVEFLGNYYHGFPPEHPQHLSFTCVGGKTSPQLHRETFERLDLFLQQNLRVFYVWEHEFTEWQKLASRRCLERFRAWRHKQQV